MLLCGVFLVFVCVGFWGSTCLCVLFVDYRVLFYGVLCMCCFFVCCAFAGVACGVLCDVVWMCFVAFVLNGHIANLFV